MPPKDKAQVAKLLDTISACWGDEVEYIVDVRLLPYEPCTEWPLPFLTAFAHLAMLSKDEESRNHAVCLLDEIVTNRRNRAGNDSQEPGLLITEDIKEAIATISGEEVSLPEAEEPTEAKETPKHDVSHADEPQSEDLRTDLNKSNKVNAMERPLQQLNDAAMVQTAPFKGNTFVQAQEAPIHHSRASLMSSSSFPEHLSPELAVRSPRIPYDERMSSARGDTFNELQRRKADLKVQKSQAECDAKLFKAQWMDCEARVAKLEWLLYELQD